jgi:hypothetical protein
MSAATKAAKWKIYETTVKPDGAGSLVQIQISDGPPPYAPAATFLALQVRIPAFAHALTTQIEHQAMRIAKDALLDLIHSAAQQSSIAPENLHEHTDPIPKTPVR